MSLGPEGRYGAQGPRGPGTILCKLSARALLKLANWADNCIGHGNVGFDFRLAYSEFAVARDLERHRSHHGSMECLNNRKHLCFAPIPRYKVRGHLGDGTFGRVLSAKAWNSILHFCSSSF